ncbi:hypothetical protein BG011_008306 [Mortierella polycephala]|uniref:Uncharacterized protein n=1 Tax=Mortierella polycephala TaxID=41804 RepID=A0A9P6U8G9_9FUNG|nr:hypothetical protein BG011_008306 [Mortierella polycephala]
MVDMTGTTDTTSDEAETQVKMQECTSQHEQPSNSGGGNITPDEENESETDSLEATSDDDSDWDAQPPIARPTTAKWYFAPDPENDKIVESDNGPKNLSMLRSTTE